MRFFPTALWRLSCENFEGRSVAVNVFRLVLATKVFRFVLATKVAWDCERLFYFVGAHPPPSCPRWFWFVVAAVRHGKVIVVYPSLILS